MRKLEVAGEALLKKTTSRCPICHEACPAEVWLLGTKQKTVWLRRHCMAHGSAEICISSDARFYWLAQGKPGNQCCGGNACSASDGAVRGSLGRNAGGLNWQGENQNSQSGGGNSESVEIGIPPVTTAQETLSTCLALIEIVNSCNLACPTCYADSPLSNAVDALPLADLRRRIQGVIDRKGRIEILQLSGGEPTLHPGFFELLEWCYSHPKIDYVLLNTNGVRIARDDAFLDELGKSFRRGKFQLYLQFDGSQEAGQRVLRGADLRALRLRAIERCASAKIPITLAMTVTPDNLPHLWSAIETGLSWPNVRGISFQPMFGTGRVPGATGASRAASGAIEAPSRVNTADIILASVEQSGGHLKFEDFTPLPCGDPNCATIGYLLKANGRTYSVSDFLDFGQVQGFLRDKVRYRLEDLIQCGCESEALGRMLREFEMTEENTFRLFIKPFMDSWTWDEDRIDRCCTHVIRPDGVLDSFCRYYAAGGAVGLA